MQQERETTPEEAQPLVRDLKKTELDVLVQRLENSGLHEYVKLSQRTWKVLWMNFLSGIARGLGFTVGTAIVLAVLYKVATFIISMNIPYIQDWLTDLVVTIKGIQ